MKKSLLAALLACLLLLSACQSRQSAETAQPSPTQSEQAPSGSLSPEVTPSAPGQPEATQSVQPEPTPSQSLQPDSAPSPSLPPEATQSPAGETPPAAETPTVTPPAAEGTVFPNFLLEFPFTHAETLILEAADLQFLTCYLDREEMAGLQAVMAMDTWWEATDFPAIGLEGASSLYDWEGHTLVIENWGEDRCVILAKYDEESYVYYAPISVLTAFKDYLADKPFLPDFIRYFSMDQIEVGHTSYADRDGYRDFEVYLLNNSEQLSFFWALDPDSWTVARGDEVAVQYPAALTARDPEGNSLVLVPWDEKKCLVNCFYADGWTVSRHWAPASALGDALELVDGLTPLGVMDSDAARYYDLLRNDPGFITPLVLEPTDSGDISDDQMAAHMLTVLGYQGRINYELGVSPSTVDELTVKYFGKTVRSYDTVWSMTLPTGNVTATGWDAGPCFPVLAKTPSIAGDGTVTATFRVYTFPESMWLDGVVLSSQLRHIREYLLTGNDSVYVTPLEYLSCDTVEITFRVEAEDFYDIGQEYVVYESIRRVE